MISVFGGCCEHFVILLFSVLFCITSICMYVCEWCVLMATVLVFSSKFFSLKGFPAGFFSLGEVGLLPPK